MPKKPEPKADNTVAIDVVQDILDYMEANLLEVLTPARLAKQFYLSTSSLNIIFRVVCGMTVMEYIRNRRLSLAGKELAITNIPMIDLAFNYGYETPEAFSKAFARFHGFPPSFVRRAYPETREFHPLTIKLEITGGWDSAPAAGRLPMLTKQNSPEQEESLLYCYDRTTKYKGEASMKKQRQEYHISIKDMQQKEDWRVLLSLAEKLDREKIKFKVDGKTMIFAHGLEFKLEKICLTFKWNEEQRVKDFFNYSGKAKSSFKGFKYFDSVFEDRKVRCMFYGDCPGDDTDELLFRNAEPVDVDGQIIPVQTLEFYYENTEPNNEYYQMVENWLKTH